MAHNFIPIKPQPDHPLLTQVLKDIDTNFARLKRCCEDHVAHHLIPIKPVYGYSDLTQVMKDIDRNFVEVKKCCAGTRGGGTAATITAATGTRRWGDIDITSDGVLWAITDKARYSLNNGRTWADATAGDDPMVTTAAGASVRMYIDADNNCHIVYTRVADNHMCYKFGTRNTPTGWTWSAEHVVVAATGYVPVNIVAHAYAGNYKAHIALQLSATTMWYHRVNITGGVASNDNPGGNEIILNTPAYAASTRHCFIDFTHTLAAPKVPVGGTPNLYAMGINTLSGNSKSVVRFNVATEASGWTWGATPTLITADTTADHRTVHCALFDGTNMVCSNCVTANGKVILDFYNVATGLITQVTGCPTAPANEATPEFTALAMDTAGNYFVFLRSGLTTAVTYMTKYDPAAITWSAWETVSPDHTFLGLRPLQFVPSGTHVGVMTRQEAVPGLVYYTDTGHVSP